MASTILLTAFGPFPGARFNPTGALVKQLAARQRLRLSAAKVVTHVFHTSYADVDSKLSALISEHCPDIVLMFGLAARTPHLRIETRAANRISAFVPDASGKIRTTARIRPDGPDMLRGRAPFQTLAVALRRAGMQAKLSRDAGAYLCNYAYWQALEEMPRAHRPALVLFVHVPQLMNRRPVRKRAQARRHTAEDFVRAGEIVLRGLMAAARSRR